MQNAGTQPPGSLAATWKQRAVLFLAGQNVSLFGSSLVQYAILWHITLETQSGATLTLATLASFVPQILLAPFAGVWADRYNRKRLIIFADLLTAGSTLALAIVFLLGHDDLWLLYLVSAIRSLGAGVQMPAVGALLPQIVPTEHLMRVNGINSTIQPVLFIVSPLAAGALMTLSPLQTIFFVDVFTAAIAVGLLLALPVASQARAGAHLTGGYLGDFKAGVKYIHNHGVVRTLFTFNAAFHVLVSPAAFLTPLLVARSFGEEVWRLTANEIVFFVGMIAGGALMSSWGGFKNRLQTIGVGCVLAGLLFAGLGLAREFTLYLGIMLLCGIPAPMIMASSTTLMQEMVENDMQGRVFGVAQLITHTAMPAGMLLFGPLADRVAVESLLVVSGMLIALPGVWLFFNRQIPRRQPAPAPCD